MDTWLLVDTMYLCHRARHTTGAMGYGGCRIGVSFGVVSEIERLMDRFDPKLFVFAFDSVGRDKRRALCPGYKANRYENKTEEEKEQMRAFYKDVECLKCRVLPQMGFSNVFRCEGYEGDDIIASISSRLPLDTDAVIVSADSDLWQCISSAVCCYNPTTKTILNLDAFTARFGISPSEWSTVKAIAGCRSDNVQGVEGVGEKTALKWMRGELNGKNKAASKILESVELIHSNMGIVRLPLDGVSYPSIREDSATNMSVRSVRSDLVSIHSEWGSV